MAAQGITADDLFPATQAQPPAAQPPAAPPPAAQPAISEVITDPDIIAKFKEAQSAGEGYTAPERVELLDGRDAGLGAESVLSWASDETERIRYLASKLYPNEDMDEAAKRFGVQDDVLYHRADDGKHYKALPEGILAGAASLVGHALPVVAAGVVGAATMPATFTGIGVPASMAATAAAGAGGEYARQSIGDWLMGPASTNDIDEMAVAKEAAMSGLGQGIGVGMAGWATKNAVRDIAKLDTAATDRAYREAAAESIDITPGEATNLPSLLGREKYFGEMTGTTDEMAEFYANRDMQIVDRLKSYLDNISTKVDAEDVGIAVRKSAEGWLDDTRAVLRAKARPAYDVAYSKVVPFDEHLAELLTRPTMKNALARAARLAADDGRPLSKSIISGEIYPDLRTWDYIKQGLDDFIGSDAALNKTTMGFNKLGQRAIDLKTQMLKGDPSTGARGIDFYVPEYAAARKIYENGVGDIAGSVGSALKIIANTKDQNIIGMARHIFNPKTRTPNMIKRVRTAIEGKDPAAWGALKRLYLNDVTVDALRMSERGKIINTAGKLVAAFSDPRLRDNMMAAMTPDEFTRLNKFLIVLRRASRAPATRSDTAWNQEMIKQLHASERPLDARIVRNINPGTALETYNRFRTEKNLDKHARAAVEMITSNDPNVIYLMKELRRLSPLDKSWRVIFGQLLMHSGEYGVEQMLPSPDQAPQAQ